MARPRPQALSIAAVVFAAAGCDDEPTTAPGGTECSVSATWELSPAIPTVAVVTLSTNHGTLDSAVIEYGPDSNYGRSAVVDTSDASDRALLLGLKASSEYHFRVTASSEGSSCTSEDYTLTTGAVDNGLRLPALTTQAAGDISHGFLLLSEFSAGPNGMVPGPNGDAGAPGEMMMGEAGGPMMIDGAAGGPMMIIGPDGSGDSLIYVLDHEGDPVWWRTVPVSEVSRVQMSYDGRFLLAMSINVAGETAARLVKVSMDGLDIETLDLPNAHHDFTVTPDGGIVFIRKSEDDCDEITKRSSDGSLTPVFRVADAFGGNLEGGMQGDRCHTNSIHYNELDDSFTFSVLNMNCYVKVSAAGELQWVLGGEFSDFGGDGAEWSRQHGHHWLGENRLLLFNNGGPGTDASLALEVELDPDQGVAQRVFSYAGGYASGVLGDVWRLENGNTLVAYSTAGVIHQVNEQGSLVAELTWPLGGAFGYVNHRSSLYGPPQR